MRHLLVRGLRVPKRRLEFGATSCRSLVCASGHRSNRRFYPGQRGAAIRRSRTVNARIQVSCNQHSFGRDTGDTPEIIRSPVTRHRYAALAAGLRVCRLFLDPVEISEAATSLASLSAVTDEYVAGSGVASVGSCFVTARRLHG